MQSALSLILFKNCKTSYHTIYTYIIYVLVNVLVHADATVEMRCNGTTMANTTTNASGNFTLAFRPTRSLVMRFLTLPDECKIVVPTTLDNAILLLTVCLTVCSTFIDRTIIFVKWDTLTQFGLTTKIKYSEIRMRVLWTL